MHPLAISNYHRRPSRNTKGKTIAWVWPVIRCVCCYYSPKKRYSIYVLKKKKKVCLKSLGTFSSFFSTFLFFFLCFIYLFLSYLYFSFIPCFFCFFLESRRFNDNHLFSSLSFSIYFFPILVYFPVLFSPLFLPCHVTSHHTHVHTPGHKETRRCEELRDHWAVRHTCGPND